jgi:hypothetical protein
MAHPVNPFGMHKAHMTAETSKDGKKPNTEATEIGARRPQRWRGGYHPRGDRKSAEAIENRRDRGLPLRKRVRNRMIMLGLQGCDRRERTWDGYLSS